MFHAAPPVHLQWTLLVIQRQVTVLVVLANPTPQDLKDQSD